jgi:hypothetical protein
VHNDFSDKGEWERLGNEVDVKNLRRVFEKRPNCKFAELKNCGKEEILRALRSDEQLTNLFHPDSTCTISFWPWHRSLTQFLIPFSGDALQCSPEALFFFILSHGQSAGVILTDKFKQDEESMSPEASNFETYTVKDIFNSLTASDLLKQSLKILLIGVSQINYF